MENKTSHTSKYVLPSILNFDELYSRTPNTILFNELMLDRTPEEVIEMLCDISSDKSDSVAACQCREMSANYFIGMKCPQCGTIVSNNLFGEIRNDSWLEIPKSIKGVLNPQVFRVITRWMGNVKKIPILDQLLDMQMKQEPILGTPFFTGMGFNWFYDNFDSVVSFFITTHRSTAGRLKGPEMKLFLERAGSAIWCTKLPILSKLIQPIEKMNDVVRYADKDSKALIEAIFTLKSILLSEKIMKFSTDHVDRNFYKVYSAFMMYVENIMRQKLPKKESILRKHVFGCRSHCSGRSVAIPITGPHRSDEIYLPWKIGVKMYFYHILSVLTNKANMTTFKAFDRIMNAINVYDHDIDIIMQELIRDCPYQGLPIMMNRNPSLNIAAIQLLFVTKIKPALSVNPFAIQQEPSTEMLISDDSDDQDVFGDRSELIDKRSGRDRRFGLVMNTNDRRHSTSFSYDDDMPELERKIISYVEDGTIEVSPLIVKGPNLD